MAKVAILMNCYNGEAFLREAMDSVFAQTFEDWQIIFIDNCSVDASAEIAASYGDKVKVVKTEKNVPLYEARNFGLQYIEDAEYVGFLDVDDLWAPRKLEKQLAKFSADVSLVYTKVKVIDEQSQVLSEVQTKLHQGHVTQQLLVRNFIAISSVLMKASVLKDVKFDVRFNLIGDFDFWLRISVDHKFDFVDEYLFYTRQHGNNLSVRNKGRWIKELRVCYTAFLKKYKVRFPNILFFIAKCEAGHLLGRH